MEHKLEEKKFFYISIETFRVDVSFFINYSVPEAIKITSKKKRFEKLNTYLKDCDYDALEGANEGRLYPLNQGFAVFLKFYKNSHRINIALASHEISHLVSWILMDRRIPLSKDSDEVYAYLTEEIMKKFLYKWY